MSFPYNFYVGNHGNPSLVDTFYLARDIRYCGVKLWLENDFLNSSSDGIAIIVRYSPLLPYLVCSIGFFPWMCIDAFFSVSCGYATL